MSNRPSARAQKTQNIVDLFELYLAEEEAREDVKSHNGSGRHLEARSRAMERVAEKVGHTNRNNIRSTIIRWEAVNYAKPDFWTFGLELDPKFSMVIRQRQNRVDEMLEACAVIEKGCKLLGWNLVVSSKLFTQLESERPRFLCPFCKDVVPDCERCDGDGWFDEIDGMKCPQRLLDSEDIHVQAPDGKVVTLDEWEELL